MFKQHMTVKDRMRKHEDFWFNAKHMYCSP
jgi:hypothetical protein